MSLVTYILWCYHLRNRERAKLHFSTPLPHRNLDLCCCQWELWHKHNVTGILFVWIWLSWIEWLGKSLLFIPLGPDRVNVDSAREGRLKKNQLCSLWSRIESIKSRCRAEPKVTNIIVIMTISCKFKDHKMMLRWLLSLNWLDCLGIQTCAPAHSMFYLKNRHLCPFYWWTFSEGRYSNSTMILNLVFSGICFGQTAKALQIMSPRKDNHCLQVYLQANLHITWTAFKLIIRLPHTQISDTTSCHCYEAVSYCYPC